MLSTLQLELTIDPSTLTVVAVAISHGKSLFHLQWITFFPTSLCGVLVFDSASRPPPSASRRLLASSRLTHLLTHILHTYNLLTHNLLTHNLLTHNLFTHNLSTHNLSTVSHGNVAWQARHFVTSTFTLCDWCGTLRGRRGTYGTGLALVARLV